jgi:hypothetical protein
MEAKKGSSKLGGREVREGQCVDIRHWRGGGGGSLSTVFVEGALCLVWCNRSRIQDETEEYSAALESKNLAEYELFPKGSTKK